MFDATSIRPFITGGCRRRRRPCVLLITGSWHTQGGPVVGKVIGPDEVPEAVAVFIRLVESGSWEELIGLGQSRLIAQDIRGYYVEAAMGAGWPTFQRRMLERLGSIRRPPRVSSCCRLSMSCEMATHHSQTGHSLCLATFNTRH